MEHPVRGSTAVSSGNDMWYYMQNGKKSGPIEADKIVGMLSAGELPPDTHVWTKGMDKWTPANATELVTRANSQKPASTVISLDSPRKSASRRKSRWWIGLVAGIVLVAVVAAAWFVIMRREKTQEVVEEPVITYGLKDPVVFENAQCAFIIDGIGEKGDYLELDVRCVNKTEEALSFSWDSTSVNGNMFDPLWDVYVYGNSTTKSSITFPLSTLASYRLLPAEQIRFVLSVYNEDQFEQQQKESAKYIVRASAALENSSLYSSYRYIEEYPGYLFAQDVRTDDDGRPYYVNEEGVTVYFDEILDSDGDPLYGILSGVSQYNDFYNDRYTRPYYFSNTGTTVYYDGYGFAFMDEETGRNYYYAENGEPAYYGNSGVPEYYEGTVSQELLDAGKPEQLVKADGNFLVHKEFTIYPTGKAAGEVTAPDRISLNTEQIYWEGEKGNFVVLGGKMDVRGYVLNTYVENKSDSYVYFGWNGITVNGYPTGTGAIAALRPRSKTYRDIVIPKELLEEYKIVNVEQIDFRVYAVGENLSVPLYPINWKAPIRK